MFNSFKSQSFFARAVAFLLACQGSDGQDGTPCALESEGGAVVARFEVIIARR